LVSYLILISLIYTANDAVTNRNAIFSVVTGNNDSEDGFTFDSIVSK